MVRPLRLEMADGHYHVMARGNWRAPIYKDDDDRLAFLDLLQRSHERLGWNVLAYCLMTNHYHLLVHTPEPNLSRGMRDVNGIFTQRFNRRHGKVGHVLQGRYTAHVVDKDSYLTEVARYVVLNPVRARMVAGPRQYKWSSYRATIGQVEAPSWLAVEPLLLQFSRRRSVAIEQYRCFVQDGVHGGGKLEAPKHALFYGGQQFIEQMLMRLDLPDELPERRRSQRSLKAKPIDWYASRYQRDEAIAFAWATGAYTLREIGTHFGLHYQSVSRIVRSRKRNV